MNQLDRYEYTTPTMGTTLQIVVYSESEVRAQQAIDAALDTIERLIPILSNYDSESEVSRLSRESHRAVQLSPDLAAVLKASKRWHGLSQGRFDITIGPLTQLWSQARRDRRLPDPTAVEDARSRSGWDNLRLSSEGENAPQDATLELLAQGMRIDVSGIATGYIIDKAFEAIVRTDHERILINIGGDIRVGISPPEVSGWKIDVAGIGKTSPMLCQMRLHSCALTTSGDLNQFVEIEGRRYSHLMDPTEFRPLERRQSATVIADTALDADVGATAICILGIDRAAQGFDTLPIREAIVLEMERGTSINTTVRHRHLMAE